MAWINNPHFSGNPNHCELNLLKNKKTAKDLQAGWNNNYLLAILNS